MLILCDGEAGGSAQAMAMADDGYRRAYNLQFKTDPKRGCLAVGTKMTNKASHSGQLDTAVEEIEQRNGVGPQRLLADGAMPTRMISRRCMTRRSRCSACFLARSASLSPTNPMLPSTSVRARTSPAWLSGMNAWASKTVPRSTPSASLRAARCRCSQHEALVPLPRSRVEKVNALALRHAIAYNFLQIPRLSSFRWHKGEAQTARQKTKAWPARTRSRQSKAAPIRRGSIAGSPSRGGGV